MVQVVKDWFKIGLEYPNKYIDVFLCVTEGFWYPDARTYCAVPLCDSYHDRCPFGDGADLRF